LFGLSSRIVTTQTTSPADGAVFPAPASITVNASASVASGNTIARVEFYQGASLIGTSTAAPYTFAWTNVASGTYALTAVVVDNLGTSTSSAAVTVKVNAAPTITLTSPPSGANATAPAAIAIVADALDADGTIARVAFFRNGVPITGAQRRALQLHLDGGAGRGYVLRADRWLGKVPTKSTAAISKPPLIRINHPLSPRVPPHRIFFAPPISAR
jgi:hypothetical protein